MKKKTAINLGILLSTQVAAETMPEFSVARISRDVQILSSDAYEGRAPATRAESKTIGYIAAQMNQAGLMPAGDNGTWFQNVPLLRSQIVGSPILTLDVGGIARPLSQDDQIVARATLTGQRPVTISNAP